MAATVDNNCIEQSIPAQTAHSDDGAQNTSRSQGSGLTLQHARDMLKNEPVGIVVISSRGWIIATIIAIAKFMAKLTGSHLVIHYLDDAPVQ